MERLSLRIPGFENYLPDECRVVGVLGDSCLLVEDNSPACPAAYAVYIKGFNKGPFALVGHYVTPRIRCACLCRCLYRSADGTKGVKNEVSRKL